MDWNLIFRQKVIELKLHKRLHNSLMELCVAGKIKDPECFLRAWLLFGNEKPQVFIYPTDDFCLVAIGYRALPIEYTPKEHSICSKEHSICFKEQMLWKCVFLYESNFVVWDAISPLTTKAIITKEYVHINNPKVLIDNLPKGTMTTDKWLPHNHNFGYLGLQNFKVIEYRDYINFGIMYPIHRSKDIYISIVVLRVIFVILFIISISLYFQIRHHSLGFLGNYLQY